MKKISLIPYACGAGADNKACADGPAVLKEMGLARHLKAQNIDANWLEANLNADKTSNIALYCNNLKNQVQDVLQNGGFPVSVGGDHSMAIGTWAGVADSLHTKRKLGLIWIDAHMDAHTMATSPSGNKHGMPISYLLGYGNDELADITKRAPVIAPNHLCLIGIRSYEIEEAEFLHNIGVKIFTMEQIRERGLDAIMLEAVKIASAHTSGFGISIDIDAFDPQIAPGTGTLENNGILKDEFIDAMQNTLAGYKDKLLALEIAEYNPHLDKNYITANLIGDIIAAILLHHKLT